ncbi:MAG: hypothetical protein JWO32_3102 [Bacteroidetes bacterium]|nr:hypothetical protein [Bacteroidota bacterium]
MKNTLLLSCCFLIAGKISAQTIEEKWNVGAHCGITQYSGDLGQGFYSTNQAVYGFAGFSVSRYLTERWDATLLMTSGEAGYLASRDYTADMNLDYNFHVSLTTANLGMRYNLRDRERIIVPYIFGGASLIRQKITATGKLNNKPLDFAVPTGGIGFNIRLNPTVAIQFQEMYMYTMSDKVDSRVNGYNDSYLFHTAGVTFNLGKYRRMEGSRVGNKIDKCPDMKPGFKKRYEDAKKKTKAKIDMKQKTSRS